MITFIIYILLEIFSTAKEIYVYIDEQQTIDTFEEFGVILDANITYRSQNLHLCQIIKQRVNNLIENQILLGPQINESVFNQYYIDGSLKLQGNYYYIVSMVPINNGTIILLSNGILTYIYENNNNIFKIESDYSIFNVQNQLIIDTVYMFYLSTTHKIMIILNNQLIYVQLNINQSNIFGQYTNQIDEKILNTQNIEFIDDYLFIVRQNQFTIYSFKQQDFEKIYNNNNITINIIDFKVKQEDDEFQIFFLHRWYGVKVCIYDLNLQLFNEVSSYNDIPMKGYKIGLYKHILMIVEENNDESIINELHQSKINNKWTLSNQYQIQNIIKDIKFTEDYAILIGNYGHQIIYHSLPNADYQIQQQIVIPGLQQIYLLSQTESQNQSLIGITKNTYFISKFYMIPQKIICQYNQELSSIQFTYYQNSTQCSKLKQKKEGELCLYISNYTVSYKYPLITSKQIIYILKVLAFILVIITTTIFFIHPYIRKKKQKKVYLEIKSNSSSNVGTPVHNEQNISIRYQQQSTITGSISIQQFKLSNEISR
ncbi:unnamed protein product [Paramecium primaurelia]|uniref:Transmembrane protein n=1 Tax=Paramecium primaurelia TaxID=5886 RepID=A0A8S1NJ64_PARPR|nr:unnamed protein product [Paramecium primaurelia]